MTGTPLVSIVMAAYRHAKYIDEAVESALNQTIDDIEVIVVDDGSNDETVAKLRRNADRRLLVAWQPNAGPSAAFNRAFTLARGKFVAVMAGDDVSLPERLEWQLSTLEENDLDAIFGRPLLIDEQGSSLHDERLEMFFGPKATMSSRDLLRRLFFDLNFLCAPSAVFRRELLDRCGLFQPALYQLQDFDLWLRMCRMARVGLSDDRVVKYRLRDHEANLSNTQNNHRTEAEYAWVFQRLYDQLDPQTVAETFKAELEFWGLSGVDAFLQRILVYMLHEQPYVRAIALRALIDRFGGIAPCDDRIRFGDFELRTRDLAQMLAVAP